MIFKLIIGSIASLVPLLFVGFFIFAIVKGNSFWSYYRRVKSMVNSFETGVTEEQVRDYITLVRGMKMVNYPDLWNTMRAGFTLVNNADNISYESKKELMNLLLSKGVSLGNVKIHKGREVNKSL